MEPLNPYQALKKKTQDKIDKAKKEFAAAKKEAHGWRDDILDQEKKEKKEPKKYDAKKHKQAKKDEIELLADCKRFEREITLLEAQLKDFADGFETFAERQKLEQNVKDHAKSVFFEVEKYTEKMGDTTKKLKAAYEQCQKLYDEKKDELSELGKQQSELGQTIAEAKKSQSELDKAEAEFPKVKEKYAKLTGEVVMLKKKLAVVEERYLYYEKQKAAFKKMLADGQIDDKEYKYYKEALKRELK